MACASEQEKYQQWLAQINQVCGRFDARPLEGEFIGELETSYARSLKLSTVTAGGVNLFRTRQEIKNGNDAWFYTVFQLEGSAELEQDDRRSILKTGDITLIDAHAPARFTGRKNPARFRCSFPVRLLSNSAVSRRLAVRLRCRAACQRCS
jgi:AraC family transcriptional activator of tynA and feaB